MKPQVVKKPMDFGTIDCKMKAEAYDGPEDFYADVTLTLQNAILYNTSSENPVHQVRWAALVTMSMWTWQCCRVLCAG